MEITNQYTDDHAPCLDFTHNGREFSLLWTSRSTASALEYFEESNKARKKIKPLVEMIENPDSVEDEDDNPEFITAYTDYGCLIISR